MLTWVSSHSKQCSGSAKSPPEESPGCFWRHVLRPDLEYSDCYQWFRVAQRRSWLEPEPCPGVSSGTAKGPNRPMMSGSKPEPHLKPWFLDWDLHTAEPDFCELGTLPPIKYLSSYRITIWYICTRCSFGCSFTSCFSMRDPINIGWVAVK